MSLKIEFDITKQEGKLFCGLCEQPMEKKSLSARFWQVHKVCSNSALATLLCHLNATKLTTGVEIIDQFTDL